jgi:hypothetical protein
MVNIFIGLINIFNGNSPRSLCVGCRLPKLVRLEGRLVRLVTVLNER